MNKSHHHENTPLLPRREFLTTLATSLGAASLASIPASSATNDNGPLQKLTVQQIIDLILAEIPGAPFKETVDIVKAGDVQQPVSGIVTTMFATIDVIKKAIALNANFIIVHEPTFYNHLDETTWLESDAVFQFKHELLRKHKIVVWRFHDYWHTHQPDGILMGVLTKLGWQNYYNPQHPLIVELPSTTLTDLITHAKKSLGIRQVRVVGDLKQVCKRIALLPGAAGGRAQIQLLQKEKPDVLICGEVNEWETSEYIRDARAMGSPMSLVVLGHAESEEPGMEWLVKWLQPKIKNIKVTHIASFNPFIEV